MCKEKQDSKAEFSLVTPGLQGAEANALTQCTTKSPSLSNYHRTSPVAVTFCLPQRSESEVLSEAIHLSAGFGAAQSEITCAVLHTAAVLQGYYQDQDLCLPALSVLQHHGSAGGETS